MPGAYVQLQSEGVQDIYLTGKPEITFFKSTYKRHTQFAIESIEQTFDGAVDFNKMPTVTFPRSGGDLLGAVWLEIKLPDLLGYDITPAPAEGNSVDVTGLTGNVFTDSSGSYWQSRSGSPGSYTYANVIALHDGSGRYFTSGTPGNVASYTGNVETWPYMTVANTANAAVRTFGVPTTNLRYANAIGLALVKSVELEVGGSRLDKHYSEWWDIWSELSEKSEKLEGFNVMVGKDPEYAAGWKRKHATPQTLYVPLRFCYNRNPGLYLPLTALPFSQVKMNFEFRNYLELVRASVPVYALTSKAGALPLAISSCRIFADYVFLDAPERAKILQNEHEYLVTQLQFQGDESVPSPSDPNGTVNRKISLNFSQPVREIVWVYQAASSYAMDAVEGNDIFNYEIPGGNVSSTEVFTSAKLVINGSDRFAARSGPYFRLVQPYEHHTRIPSKSVYVFSFADGNTEDPQPKGQANFSKYDSAQMYLSLNPNLPAGRVKFYAVGYNVFRCLEGMGGLMFT